MSDAFKLRFEENPLAFLNVYLSPLYFDYFAFPVDGDMSLLREEIEDLFIIDTPFSTDTWAFVDHWTETFFQQKNFRASNAIREILALTFAYFEESELLDLLAERFQTDQQSLLMESNEDTVLDWMILYTAQHFPHLNDHLQKSRSNQSVFW